VSLSASIFGRNSAIFKVTNILGLGIPGFLDKKFGAQDVKPPVQRIGELSNQTAKEGEPRPIVWGRVRPIGGNIMHISTPRIENRKVKGQSSGGKGGKKKQPKQYEERVFRSYAISICEGPITAIMRVWRNNKLVYDARGNDWGSQNNAVFLKKARFYLGGWDQMPDPTLESIWGAGEVPGYRGTCYMVVTDEDLTELGGMVPQYIFEVERAEGVALTSRPYAVDYMEGMDAYPATARAAPSASYLESLDAGGASIVAGELRSVVQPYTLWPVESLDATGASIISGSLASIVKSYTLWPAESLDATGATIIAGELKTVVITYSNWPVESLDATGATIIGGSLHDQS
jgi:hypothetical protein